MSQAELDWLDNDAIAAAKEENAAKRVEFAENYRVFETNPQARALLEHWTSKVLNRRTPVNATIQQYAADEAIRAFVAGIHEELRIAREGKV